MTCDKSNHGKIRLTSVNERMHGSMQHALKDKVFRLKGGKAIKVTESMLEQQVKKDNRVRWRKLQSAQ